MEEMPKLTKCTLLTAFKCVESVRMKNAGRLEEMEVLVNAKVENGVNEREDEWELPEPEELLESSESEPSESESEPSESEPSESEPSESESEPSESESEPSESEPSESESEPSESEPFESESESSESESESSELSEPLYLSEILEPIVEQPMISSKNDWERMNRTIEVMNVSDNSCNGKEMKELDLSGFVNLRKIKVGNECFTRVKKVNICGLKELESVEIGSKSFRRDSDTKGGSFYLKNCPKLKSLKMGLSSFEGYSVCEIENVDALEVIEMGILSDWSANFWHASLELKSILIQIE